MATQALDIVGDHGEFHITPEMMLQMSSADERRLDAAMQERLRATPGLQINSEMDIRSGHWVIRWRTRL